jgi:hypothetical protein
LITVGITLASAGVGLWCYRLRSPMFAEEV